MLPSPLKGSSSRQGNWSTIVSTLYPGVLLSHRTAFEYKPGPEGEIFLTASTNREVVYPGLRLKFSRGPGPLDDDPPFLAARASSQARVLLENLSKTRSRTSSRTVGVSDIEARLEQILRDGGEEALNKLRDRARQIAKRFSWRLEFERLDGLMGALLGTRTGKRLNSKLALARAAGEPYDPAALTRLQLLFGELRSRSLPAIRDTFTLTDHFSNKAFFEAYFSNYIEGTMFEVEEAEEIVFERKIPAKRPKDAHDILGTYKIIGDPNELRKTPRSFEEFRTLLLGRHHTLMERRPEASPGQLKDKPNRAGDTVFVQPELVTGTLKKGFELYADLPEGLARAVFMMFLVADVHPFVDGNGRIARIMMNSELLSAGLSTIIIPNVFRDDYLGALRSLTRRDRPRPLVDMAIQAQKLSHLEFSPYPAILKELQRRNWFREPDEAKIDLSP